MSGETSYPKNKINFLLLENIHEVAVQKLKAAGYSVEVIGKSLAPEDLAEKLREVHVLGIRSKTKVGELSLQGANRLLAIGCFGVGTNQVDLTAAAKMGVPVFNAPFGNTRSVAELCISHVISLARKAAERNCKMHQGFWEKSAKGSKEVRGKTLGLVGYGHIGQQTAILGEALGMRVIFYDTVTKLALGTAKQVESLDRLLEEADFVSLHVPALPGGKALMDKAKIQRMKKGSYLLNLSRGTLIDFAALREAIETQHLAGAALDVYPNEPKTNSEEYDCGLRGLSNVILTPHLGGSTEEAQYNIGEEVAAAFIKFIDCGTTHGAVNFPQIDLPSFPNSHRILNIHRNEPGVLSSVNKIISGVGANIDAQYLSTFKDIGYLIMDIDKEMSMEVKEQMEALPTNIKTRILY